MTRCKNSS